MKINELPDTLNWINFHNEIRYEKAMAKIMKK